MPNPKYTKLKFMCWVSLDMKTFDGNPQNASFFKTKREAMKFSRGRENVRRAVIRVLPPMNI